MMEETGGLTAIRDLPPTPQAPVEQGPANGAAPTTSRHRGLSRRAWLILGGVLLLFLLAGIGGNLALTNAYGPRAALATYLTAQMKGDVDTMWQNASLQRPEGSYNAFFDKAALVATMRQPANRAFASFSILQMKSLDGNASTATVRLTSRSGSTTQTFGLIKDSGSTHFLVYASWRVVVPPAVIRLSLPNQAGAIRIDAIAVPESVKNSIAVISGVHHVYMAESPLVQSAEADVSATPGSDSSISFQAKLKPEAVRAAADAVNGAFNNCDATKKTYCFGHTYPAPKDGYVHYMKAGDGSIVYFTHYTLTLVGDPTATMIDTIEAGDGQVSVSGSCTARLTTDTRTVDHSGSFDGKLVWKGTGFDSEIHWTC